MTENEARELLENTAFKKSVETITNEYLSQIANSAVEDFEGREESYRMIKALQKIIGHFESIAYNKAVHNSKWKFF
jgi:anion-transporting  ArsA/GET3 family ATPase